MHAPPPQSTSLSLPSTTPSLQLCARQVPEAHTPLEQSPLTLHVAPVAHGEHEEPPQSTNVSDPSFTPFEHDAGRTGFIPASGEDDP
jgi:hypothetical protein